MTPIVIKLGGEVLEHEALMPFLEQMKHVMQYRPVVLVHGGGPQVETLMKASQQTSIKIDGLRATPEEQVPIVVGALAGVASQQLLSACKKVSLPAISLSLSDGELFSATTLSDKLGHVGHVQPNQPELLNLLLKQNVLVCFNSIGCDGNGKTLNINADDAAVSVAKLIDGQLYLLSNVPGVLNQDKSLIESLDAIQISQLINKGVISDGMAVKVKAALHASNHLRRRVNIGSWQDIASISALAEQLEPSFGTAIYPNEER